MAGGVKIVLFACAAVFEILFVKSRIRIYLRQVNQGEVTMTIEHVSGKNAGKIMLYALSTCIWCRKTKQLLTDLGVEYDFLYVDLLQGQEREQAVALIEKWNPDGSFPTMVVNDSKGIIGFKEDEIKGALKL
jgi:glutaredoxin-like protein NrdH